MADMGVQAAVQNSAGAGGAVAGSGAGSALGGIFGALTNALNSMPGVGQSGKIVAGFGGGAGADAATALPADGATTAPTAGLVAGADAVVNVSVTGADGQPTGVEMTGTQTNISVLLQRIDIVVQALQKNGVSLDKLGDTSDPTAQLAAALEQMGMSPEEAQAQAQRIEAAMKMAKEKLAAGGDQPQDMSQVMGQLAAMMLAATQAPQLVQQAPTAGADLTADTDGGAFAVQISVTTVEMQMSQTSVKLSPFTKAQGQAHGLGNGDTARLIAGLAGKTAKTADVPAATADVKTGLELTLDAQGATLTDDAGAVLATTAAPAALEAKAAAAQQAASGTLQAAAQVAVEAGAIPNAVAKENVLAGRATNGLTGVASDKVLGKPTGKVMYEWKASDTGVDSVKATPAVHKAMEALVTADRPTEVTPDGLGAGVSGSTTADGASGSMGASGSAAGFSNFSDRLASAMRHSAAQQATVQLQNLGNSLNAAGGGGGQIKMLLNPAELGEIRIELTVKDGAVHGTIAASDGAVVEMLARDVHQLKHGLAEAGLKLGQDGINLMLSDAGSQGSQHQQNGQAGAQASNGHGARGRADSATDGLDGVDGLQTVASNPANWVSPDRLVDIRI